MLRLYAFRTQMKTSKKAEADFIKMGYSVSRRKAEDFENIRENLFQGFFKLKVSNERVNQEYENFCSIQSKRIGSGAYSYIKSNYFLNGQPCETNILDTIYTQISEPGSQLIILEAPAGFGKTCTSYEIANLIAKNDNGKIPVLTELSKNRTARILLLTGDIVIIIKGIEECGIFYDV